MLQMALISRFIKRYKVISLTLYMFTSLGGRRSVDYRTISKLYPSVGVPSGRHRNVFHPRIEVKNSGVLQEILNMLPNNHGLFVIRSCTKCGVGSIHPVLSRLIPN